MPQTKDQRCVNVLKNFFEKEEILNDTWYELKKLTNRGWKTIQYEVCIPKVWYSRSPRVQNPNTIVWVQDEFTQEIPTIDKYNEIINSFKETFEPFEKISFIRKNNSYLRITNHEWNMEKIIFNITVQYSGTYIPFSETINIEERLKKLERENQYLSDVVSNFRRRTDTCMNNLRRRLVKITNQRDEAITIINSCNKVFREENNTYMKMYRSLINKQYNVLGKKFECPVCYEDINNDCAFTTPCGHVFCESCTSKCKNKCPICRQNMSYCPEESL